MNVGQVFELLMGWAASNLNCRVKVVPFDEMYGAEKSHQTVQAFLEEASKQPVKHGFTILKILESYYLKMAEQGNPSISQLLLDTLTSSN